MQAALSFHPIEAFFESLIAPIIFLTLPVHNLVLMGFYFFILPIMFTDIVGLRSSLRILINIGLVNGSTPMFIIIYIINITRIAMDSTSLFGTG